MRPHFDNVQNTLIKAEPENGDSSRVFIIVLFAIKPFIDLTWNIRLFSIVGLELNSLRLTGFIVFTIAGYLYFFQNDTKPIFNKRIIWVFLGLALFTSTSAIFFYNRTVMYVTNDNLRLFDAYFIYFIGHRYMANDRDRLRIIGTIWITMLLVSMLSVIQYSAGTFATGTSQGVERFAGFYSDAGTPSYNVIMATIFGTLYIELRKRQRQRIPIIAITALILTLLVTAFILTITITKSAVLMLVVFSTMWVGLYKRKFYIIVPLIVIGGYCIYTNSETVQARMTAEIEFLREDGFSLELARSMGSGRVATWERVLTYYSQNYSLFQKLFGSTGTFGAHNQYIAYLMQVGLAGLTVFLIILFRFYSRLIYLYRKHRQPDLYMCIVLLTVFTVYGLTGHPFRYTTLLWYLMILLSLINVYTYEPSPEVSLP